MKDGERVQEQPKRNSGRFLKKEHVSRIRLNLSVENNDNVSLIKLIRSKFEGEDFWILQ